jgi:hypothetical protein
LRDGEKQLVPEVETSVIDARDVRRSGCHRQTQVTFDQMLAKSRCVSRAAPRASDDQLRRLTLEARRKRRQRLRQAAWLLPDDLRGLSDLMSHLRFDFAHPLLQ